MANASRPSPFPPQSGLARPRVKLTEQVWAPVLASPALLLIMLFALGPIVGAFWLAFHRHLPIFQVYEFIGLRNFSRLLTDERFWSACGTTFYFTVVSVALELLLGLIIALLLHGPLSGQHRFASTMQTDAGGRMREWRVKDWIGVVILLPWIVPTVVSARIWEWLYHPEYGLLNYFLVKVGLVQEPINWLGDPISALHGAILMDVWKATPFVAILLLAALRAIPQDLYLAARVDGAGPWATFRQVTLPLLLPVILIVLTFRTMDAFRVFDAVYVLTGGGPGNSTETLSIYAYKTLFQMLQFGYGSALACAMFGLISLVTAAYLLLLRRQLQA
jgi:trehalose/maltose transport system permease protein